MAVVLAMTMLLYSCEYQPKSSGKEKATAKKEKGMPSSASNEQGVMVDINSLNNIYTNSIIQTFIVPAKKTVEVKTKGGLKLTIDPSALESEEGEPVSGSIIVQIAELTNSEAMFKANATTVSNGRLLVSGGSYYVGLESNGKKLKIKSRQSIKAIFPKLAENEMELFYGRRNQEGSMNWMRANEPLEFIQEPTIYNPPFPDSMVNRPYDSKFYKYGSPEKKVQFMNNIITLKQLAGELQKRGVDKHLDSIQMTMQDFYGRYYHYGICGRMPFDSIKLYGVMSCREIEEEKAAAKKAAILKNYQLKENKEYKEKWAKDRYENSIEGQMQKYYAPASITQLGWINCDRFYNNPLIPETAVELPFSFNGKSIQYFLIYKSFVGLMGGRLTTNEKKQYLIRNLPNGEQVKMICFVKANGQIYQGTNDFVTGINETLKPEFKIIGGETLKNIFGKNVKL